MKRRGFFQACAAAVAACALPAPALPAMCVAGRCSMIVDLFEAGFITQATATELLNAPGFSS